MGHSKARLFAAAIALLNFSIVFTGVSYAWLSLSTNPEITNIVASVGANQNLEIALDDGYQTAFDVDMASSVSGTQGSVAGNPYTWGNLVDLTYAFSGGVPELRQVKLNKTDSEIFFEYPLYGEDGRVARLSKLQEIAVSNFLDLGDRGGVKFYVPDSSSKKDAYAYSVTYWMRTNVSGEITFSEAHKRADDGGNATEGVNGVVGGGSYISVPIAGNGTAQEMDRFMSRVRVLLIDETAGACNILFEASICAGESDGTERVYKLVTHSEDAGDNAVYKSDIPFTPFNLEANQAKKVTLLVYLDGEELTNADALLYDTEHVKINVQFDNSAIDAGSSSGGSMTGDYAP